MNYIYLTSLNSSRTSSDLRMLFPKTASLKYNVVTPFKCVVCIRSVLTLLRISKWHWWERAILSTLAEIAQLWSCLIFRVMANTSAKHDKVSHVFLLLSPCLWLEELQGLPNTHCGKNILTYLGIPYACTVAHAPVQYEKKTATKWAAGKGGSCVFEWYSAAELSLKCFTFTQITVHCFFAQKHLCNSPSWKEIKTSLSRNSWTFLKLSTISRGSGSSLSVQYMAVSSASN